MKIRRHVLNVLRQSPMIPVLASLVGCSAEPIVFPALHVLSTISVPSTSLYISLVFRSNTGSNDTAMPPATQQIRLQLIGNNLSRPLEAWWRASSDAGPPAIHIASLQPGRYTLNLHMFDGNDEKIGWGSTAIELVSGAPDHIKVVMTYDMAKSGGQISFENALPTMIE